MPLWTSGVRGRWVASAGPGKASEETRTWKRTFRVRGLTAAGVCKARGAAATAGRGRKGNGGGGMVYKILDGPRRGKET